MMPRSVFLHPTYIRLHDFNERPTNNVHGAQRSYLFGIIQFTQLTSNNKGLNDTARDSFKFGIHFRQCIGKVDLEAAHGAFSFVACNVVAGRRLFV